jgi:hypothetical protein
MVRAFSLDAGNTLLCKKLKQSDDNPWVAFSIFGSNILSASDEDVVVVAAAVVGRTLFLMILCIETTYIKCYYIS